MCFKEHLGVPSRVAAQQDCFSVFGSLFPNMTIDFFASYLNRQLVRYVSWRPDAQASLVDAFTMSWSNEFFYAFPPFSLIRRCLEKINLDKRRSDCGASLAQSDMVYSNTADVDPTTESDVADARNQAVNSSTRHEGSQHARETEIDGMLLVRRYYESQGIPGHIASVLFKSWRASSRKQCAVHLKIWEVFCRERKIAPYSPTVTDVLEFLYGQIHLSYASLNTARSALSCAVYL